MKFFLVAVAIVGFVIADDLSDLKTFLACSDKAVREGVPSIPIPKHNPLIIDDFVYSGGNFLYSYTLGLTNNTLYDLLNYTFPVLNATSSHNPEIVVYGYEIYWPKLNFTGNWEVDVKIPLVDTDLKGTYNVVLEHVHWWGIFNLTKPGQAAQGYNETLNVFTLHSNTSSVNVEITGVVGSSVIEETLKVGLMTLMNHFPATAADFLKTKRFNDFWIGHPERINALLDFCGLNSTYLY